MSRLKFFATLFLSLFFCNAVYSKGLSYDRQKNLIDSGSISVGMNCNNLSNALGGINNLSWLPLGNKEGKYAHFILLDVYSKDPNKIHYLCEQKRFEYDNSDSATDALKDQDIVKVFYNPSKMFTYIFGITSEGSTKYILSKLTLSDYNIERDALIRARVEALMEQPEKPKPDETDVAQTTGGEIKPTETSQDTDPPVIKIAKKLTFNKASYVLKGSVKDKGSKKIYIEVDGNSIPVKNGKFSIKRYSPVSEEVEITAIDQWGNKSKKTVKVKIEIKDTDVVALEVLNPANIKPQSSNNRVALIIGIENYETTVAAVFAKNDAKWFYEYARQAFGVKQSNIKLLVDKDATIVKTNTAIYKWLKSKIVKNQTELIIFFAGHGLATSDGQELYLLQQDSDADLLKKTALSRNEFFADIDQFKPKSVTMFIDACYSGFSRDPEKQVALLDSARPVRIVGEEHAAPRNFTIFSASGLDQISSGLKEAKHGIFSYYLMKGLEGKADKNKDRKITNGELQDYLVKNVSQKALELGRPQEPSLAGNANKVLIKY